MATENLDVALDGNNNVSGRNLISGNEDDNQIVTLTDGGNLSGDYLFTNWGSDSGTESGTGPGGDDIFIFDLSLFDDDFTISVKSMQAGDIFQFHNYTSMTTVGTVTTFTFIGSDGLSHTISIDAKSTGSSNDSVQVTCFARGTMIDSGDGQVAIEDLRAGDPVKCGDGESRPVRWIGSRIIDAAALRAHPNLRPVRFVPGALGDCRPAQILRLSPQHRVLLRDWRADLLFGESEVFVPARQLVNDGSIRVDKTCEGVEYFHILLDAHHTVFANGAECETLMPAELAKTALPGEARSEILMIFPELAADLGAYGPACHMTLKGHEARILLAAESPAAAEG